jgi:hypothetical protein
MGNTYKSGSIGGRSREEIKITHALRTDYHCGVYSVCKEISY